MGKKVTENGSLGRQEQKLQLYELRLSALEGNKDMKKEKWNDGWKLIKPGLTPMMAAMMGDAGQILVICASRLGIDRVSWMKLFKNQFAGNKKQ